MLIISIMRTSCPSDDRVFGKSQGFYFEKYPGTGGGRIYELLYYLEPGESLNDRAINLPSADIEHEFWNNGFDAFIKNKVAITRQTNIQTQTAGDATRETKLLIKAAIEAVGGKPAKLLFLKQFRMFLLALLIWWENDMTDTLICKPLLNRDS